MSDDDTYDHYRVDPNADPLAHPAGRPSASFAAMREGWFVGSDGTVFPVYADPDLNLTVGGVYHLYHAAKGPRYTGYISSAKLGETFFLDLTVALDRGAKLTEGCITRLRANWQHLTAQVAQTERDQQAARQRASLYFFRLAQSAPNLSLGTEVHANGE